MRFLIYIFLFPAFLLAQPRAQQLPAILKEVSGMSRCDNGELWLLNDSGNPSDLFKYDYEKGRMLEIQHLPVKNFDWEDLTHDDKGNLYIGDFGNNRNARKNLRIFRYNPETKALDSIQFVYPDQRDFPPGDTRNWNFNGEAMVFFQDSLHLFSKNVFGGNGLCKHYVLPSKSGVYTAILRDSMVFKNRVITGAALSHDHRVLMLTSYHFGKRLGFLPYTKGSLIRFSDFQGSRFFKGKQKWKKLHKFLIIRQYESVTEWKPGVWLLANEGKALWKQRVKRVRFK